ncbi:MAG TPA: LytR C-terminal domain-containing protein [Candidatus Paceibacterota bacterium]|nr:LytR C-terminal domain-containing protein [Candidatus Paceibacterota bacterium]
MRNKLIIAAVVIVVVGISAAFVWSHQGADSLAKLASQPGAKVSGDQVDQLVARISQFMNVPSGETPSVVVLQNTADLAKQQSFYKDAQDGDILLLFSNRAIIYDALTNKLVNVGPIVQNSATPLPDGTASASASVTPSPSATPGVPEKVKVDVRNGTTKAGLAGATASTLKKNTWITIGSVSDAKATYTSTLIIDLSGGTKPNAVAALAAQLNGTVQTTIPKGEASSTADILVIVGQ